MANDRKVPGYVKKTVYNGNIEYRNFNPDLVGMQLTSDGGTPLFTMGNFNITTNLDPKLNKTYITSQFSDFVSLDNLNLTVEQTQVLLQNNAEVFLNLDRAKLSYYATFGSMTEFIRVGLENIIMNWPASIFMTPIKIFSDGSQMVVNTCENFTYDLITDTSTFSVPTNSITNRYNINYMVNGDVSGTYNESNPLRNMVNEYDSYAVLIGENEYDVLDFTGSTQIINDNVYFKVKGSPFTASTTNITYHIKPKKIVCDKFFNSLDEFEYYLLNRQSFPLYTATFKYPLRTDTGILLYTETSLTWPVTDGYNLDFETTLYGEYATKLLDLANDNDLVNSNMMNRFLVSESITGFDTMPYYLSDEEQDTSGGKVNKLLNIYGRSYDDINKYIEGISFANTVTYNKLDNTPDVYLKNIARVMGWELIESVVSNDLLSDYVFSSTSTYSGQSVGLTPAEADIELWRRIILNTPWIWKSKGARKTIEFLLRFIGTPNGLITFNEHIYKVNKPIDVELFKQVLLLNGLDDDITLYPIDEEGYPRFFADTDDMYFQNNGLWYRETSGENSVIDITTGNNPHVGPYDGGYKYFNQLTSLIPNFSAVTITSETITTTTDELFTNYNLGDITNYSGDTYVDLLTYPSGVKLDDCYVYKTEIIPDPKPSPIYTSCGCPCEGEDDSLSICLEKNAIITDLDCGARPNLSDNGYFVFNVYTEDSNGNNTTDALETLYISKECCMSNITANSGVPMYNDTYIDFINNTTPAPLIQSGYMCCDKNNNTCACNISKNWTISNSSYTIGSSEYLVFITLEGYGNQVLVGADASLCPTQWTTAIPNITDPFTGLVGFGCQIQPNLVNSLSILKAQYEQKIIDGAGCEYTFTLPNTEPPCSPPVGAALYSLVYSFNDTQTGVHNITSSNYNTEFDVFMAANASNITLSYYDVTMLNTNVGTQVFLATQTDCTCNTPSGTYWVFGPDTNGTPTNPNNPSVKAITIVDCTISSVIDYTYVEPTPEPPVITTCDAPFFTLGTGFYTVNQTVNTYVVAIAQQTDGNFVVGGRFLDYQSNNHRVYSIVRIKPDGSRDLSFNTGLAFNNPFGPLYTQDVNDIVIQSDGKILVGGGFGVYNGVNIPVGICRLNPDGSIDTSFNNGNAGIFGGYVDSIAIQQFGNDFKIIIAGSFTKYNGQDRYGIARLNSDGTLDNTFPSFTMNNYPVKAIVQPNNKIIVIGAFTSFNGDTNRKRIVRLSPDGIVEDNNSFKYVNFNGNPSAIDLTSNGKIIVGGEFSTINGNTANGIVRLNTDGSWDNQFLGSISSNVCNTCDYSINEIKVLSDDSIMVGGLTGYGGLNGNATLFKLLPNGLTDPNFTISSGVATVYAIAPYCNEQRFLIGARFNIKSIKSNGTANS